MRQVCSKCMKLVDLPDEGEDAPCPTCGEILTLPKTFSVAVDPVAVKPSLPSFSPPPPPPPPPAPPTFTPPVQTQTQPVDTNRPAPPPGYALPSSPIIPPTKGYDRSIPFNLSASKLPWIIAIALTLIFLFMPFPWCGSYPGGVSVYTQSFWGSLGNSISASIAGEQELKQELLLRPALRSDWWLLLPYLLFVIAGIALAWSHLFVKAPDFAYRIGPLGTLRAMVWPRRIEILLGLSFAAFLFFCFASLRGFGLEAAVTNVVQKNYAEEMTKSMSSFDKEKLNVKMAVDLAKFGMANGYAWWLAGLSHLTALITCMLLFWLDKRDHSPPPRLVVEW